MRATLRLVGKALPGLFRDACGLAGLAAIAYGAGLVYAPAGWIVGGLELVGTVLLLARVI